MQMGVSSIVGIDKYCHLYCYGSLSNLVPGHLEIASLYIAPRITTLIAISTMMLLRHRMLF
jgi:hypothetical protein